MASITDSIIIILKIIYFNSFSSELLKVKMFIIQINNKITDAARANKEQKIRYTMLLL